MGIKSWDQLIKPYKMAFELQKGGRRSDNLVVEPLEHGFGVTLGNALRRVLLSSIQGTAITSVKIDGVMLEFSHIPGVSEDVMDIILNLKALELDLKEETSKRYKINAQGPCVVTAGDIEADSMLLILNPEQVICTLGEDASLKMELGIERGRGYVPASSKPVPVHHQIGEIFLDAQFSPVRRVSYAVENTRVGHSTEYDKLSLFVETNGSITPKEAINAAALILQNQLSPFASFVPEESSDETLRSLGAAEGSSFSEIYFKKIDDLDLNVRCHNCLIAEKIVYLGDLVQREEMELLRTPNFGRKSLNDIKELLAGLGLKLGMKIPGWSSDQAERYLAESHNKELTAEG